MVPDTLGAGARASSGVRGAVVVVPGPRSGVVVGVVRSPALTPTRSPGGSVASPGPGGRARRGRWRRVLHQGMRSGCCPAWGRVAGSGGGGRGRRQRQAHHGGQRAAGSSCRARWGQAPSIVVPGAVSAALARGLPGMVASGGPGGAQVGGGGRSPGRQGARVGPQQPNKALEPTAPMVVLWSAGVV